MEGPSGSGPTSEREGERGSSHLGQLQPAGGCGLDYQGDHGQVGVGGLVMPQVSLLSPLGGLRGRLPPGKLQARVAAGPHAGGSGQRGQGPGPVVGAGLRGSVVRQSWGLRPGGGWRAKPFIIRMEGGGEAKGGGNRRWGRGACRGQPQLAGFG